MIAVDLENWQFSLGNSDPRLRGTPFYQEPTRLSFPTHLDLLRYLANDNSNYTAIQNQIGTRLREDVVASSWHAQRAKLSSLPHFREYRESDKYESYHAAAAAVLVGNALSDQIAMVCGLEGEIKASPVVVPTGQVLFHGRGNTALHATGIYSSFVSTSLDPIVSVLHAGKRKHQGGQLGRAFVYAITLRHDLPAIWGNGGKFDEWELLLGTQLKFTETATYAGHHFDVIEATAENLTS